MAAVGAGEWSVWLLLAGLISLICGGSALFIDRRSAAAWAGLTLSIVTVVCASVPVVDGHMTAARRGVSLSWGRYFLGPSWTDTRVLIDVQRDVEFAAPDGR